MMVNFVLTNVRLIFPPPCRIKKYTCIYEQNVVSNEYNLKVFIIPRDNKTNQFLFTNKKVTHHNLLQNQSSSKQLSLDWKMKKPFPKCVAKFVLRKKRIFSPKHVELTCD